MNDVFDARSAGGLLMRMTTRAAVALVLTSSILACGESKESSKKVETPRPPLAKPGPAASGEPVEDKGAPGEAGGAPQDPAGQDAPSPKAPAPEIP